MPECLHANLRKNGVTWVCAACGQVVIPSPFATAAETDLPKEAGVPPLGTAVPPTVPWHAQHLLGVGCRGLMIACATLPLTLLLCWAVPFLERIMWMFTTLCHEMGHTAGALLVGRPALPAFDFSFGGGVTMTGERRWWLLALYGVAAVMLWRRAGPRRWVRRVIAAVGTVVALLVVTGLDETWIVWMGFGGELVIATVFLHRALTGAAEVYPGERWLYGMVAWALLGHALGMCWMLLFDPAFQHTYLLGKRGIDNDFVRLADGLGLSLRGVAWLNLLVGLLVPIVAVIAARIWPRER
jgi:hypothetical protein